MAESLALLRSLCAGPGSVAYTKGLATGRGLFQRTDGELISSDGVSARVRTTVLELPTADAAGWAIDDLITVDSRSYRIRDVGAFDDGALTRVILAQEAR